MKHYHFVAEPLEEVDGRTNPDKTAWIRGLLELGYNTALLVSLKQISLKLGGKLIALALTAKKRFLPVGLQR